MWGICKKERRAEGAGPWTHLHLMTLAGHRRHALQLHQLSIDHSSVRGQIHLLHLPGRTRTRLQLCARAPLPLPPRVTLRETRLPFPAPLCLARDQRGLIPDAHSLPNQIDACGVIHAAMKHPSTPIGRHTRSGDSRMSCGPVCLCPLCAAEWSDEHARPCPAPQAQRHYRSAVTSTMHRRNSERDRTHHTAKLSACTTRNVAGNST